MKIISTTLEDVKLIKPDIFEDKRGFFLESYSFNNFQKMGIYDNFVQDNHSLTLNKNTIRGLHFQYPPYTQSKLVRVTKGKVLDVVVDLRTKSPTYGIWKGFELSSDNFLMLYVPEGFAHGFCTLEDNTEFQYKNNNFYQPSHECGIKWDDTTLNINWPTNNPIVSQKDNNLSFLDLIKNPF